MILEEGKVPESHGMGHCTKVLEHMNKALKSSDKNLSEDTKLACQLGALLHDADDRKYFPNSEKDNLKRVLEEIGTSKEINKEKGN